MSIADEARAEAERRYSHTVSGIPAFIAGAEWQAPRKPEAAPSDTDPQAEAEAMSLIMQKHYLDTLSARLSPDNHSSCICGEWSEGEMEPGWDDHLGEVLADAGFSRTSQPVQVEVTDDMVEKACAGFYNDASGLTSWKRLSENDPALADKYRVFIRAALSAALGGGE